MPSHYLGTKISMPGSREYLRVLKRKKCMGEKKHLLAIYIELPSDCFIESTNMRTRAHTHTHTPYSSVLAITFEYSPLPFDQHTPWTNTLFTPRLFTTVTYLRTLNTLNDITSPSTCVRIGCPIMEFILHIPEFMLERESEVEANAAFLQGSTPTPHQSLLLSHLAPNPYPPITSDLCPPHL